MRATTFLALGAASLALTFADDHTTAHKRMVRDERSLKDLISAVDTLSTKVSDTEKLQNQYPDKIAALTAVINSVLPAISRIDALVTDVEKLDASLDSMQRLVDSVDDKIDAKFLPLQSSVDNKIALLTSTLDDTADDLSDKVKDVTKRDIPDAIAKAAAAEKTLTDKLNADVALAIKAASEAGADSFFTQWGRKECVSLASGKKADKLYTGWMYGSRHNYAGGGAIPVCVKDESGPIGGNPTGGDSSDMIYPIRIDHCGYTGGTIWDRNCGDLIPCVRCHYKGKTCHMESGVDKCQAPDYEPLYKGMMWGGHQGHHGNMDRFCMDDGGSNGDWSVHDNWNGYVYPTILRGQVKNRGDRQSTVRCFMCCQK